MKRKNPVRIDPQPVVAIGQPAEDLSKLKARKPKKHRPAVPLAVLWDLALNQGIACACGCGELAHAADLDREHDPPLAERKYDPATRTYTPDANDPRYLRLWKRGHHGVKTHGPGGERRITTKGGDLHRIRHTEIKNEAHSKHLAAMREKTFGKAFK